MCGSTFLLGSSDFDRRNAGKIPFFLFLSPISLSLSLYLISSHSLMFVSPLSFFLSFSPFLIDRTSFLFVCSPISFSHFLIYHFSLISLIFTSISFSSFSLFYLSFGLHQPNVPKVGETSPHFPPLPLVITTIFSLNFLIFFSLYFPPLTHGSM